MGTAVSSKITAEVWDKAKRQEKQVRATFNDSAWAQCLGVLGANADSVALYDTYKHDGDFMTGFKQVVENNWHSHEVAGAYIGGSCNWVVRVFLEHCNDCSSRGKTEIEKAMAKPGTQVLVLAKQITLPRVSRDIDRNADKGQGAAQWKVSASEAAAMHAVVVAQGREGCLTNRHYNTTTVNGMGRASMSVQMAAWERTHFSGADKVQAAQDCIADYEAANPSGTYPKAGGAAAVDAYAKYKAARIIKARHMRVGTKDLVKTLTAHLKSADPESPEAATLQLELSAAKEALARNQELRGSKDAIARLKSELAEAVARQDGTRVKQLEQRIATAEAYQELHGYKDAIARLKSELAEAVARQDRIRVKQLEQRIATAEAALARTQELRGSKDTIAGLKSELAEAVARQDGTRVKQLEQRIATAEAYQELHGYKDAIARLKSELAEAVARQDRIRVKQLEQRIATAEAALARAQEGSSVGGSKSKRGAGNKVADLYVRKASTGKGVLIQQGIRVKDKDPSTKQECAGHVWLQLGGLHGQKKQTQLKAAGWSAGADGKSTFWNGKASIGRAKLPIGTWLLHAKKNSPPASCYLKVTNVKVLKKAK